MACGALQVNPHPGPKASREFFESQDRWLSGLDPEKRPVNPIERSETRLAEYKMYAGAMAALLPERGAVMDVGAGTGLMLSLMAGLGRRVIAVEPNALAARLARERGLTVVETWAEDLSQPEKPLAALIMNQTLDHLTRPDLFLSRAVHWLAPGGLLLLGGLINPRSIAARVYGPSFRLFHPFHQVYPCPSAVAHVLETYGFELASAWNPSFETHHGSAGKFVRATASLALKFLRLRPDQLSQAYPGNTVTYLDRRRRLFRSLRVEAAAHNL
jgi:SAM-dependent methyltransferase